MIQAVLMEKGEFHYFCIILICQENIIEHVHILSTIHDRTRDYYRESEEVSIRYVHVCDTKRVRDMCNDLMSHTSVLVERPSEY